MYGPTATRLVAAAACSAVRCLYCMYWYSVGRLPQALRRVWRADQALRRHLLCAAVVATQPFGARMRVSKRAQSLHETPAGFVRGATPAGSLKRYDGPFHGVARGPTAGGTAGTAPSRAVFGAPLTAALPAADAGTERVTSSAPRQHRSERTGA